jgi:hypothetical protein
LRIRFQPLQHFSKHRRGIIAATSRPPSPADVGRGRGRGSHELAETRRRSDVALERGEIMQVPDDCRIIVGL